MFVKNPVSTNVAIGDTLPLSARAVGSMPITHSLLFQGSVIRQQTLNDDSQAWFYLGITNSSAAGDYTVLACNATGCSTSAVAVVTVGLSQPPPRLALRLTGTGTLTLSWPASVGDCVLESTEALDGPATSWTELSPPYASSGTNLVFKESPLTRNKFYRLKKP